MPISHLHVAGYRSVRDLELDLGQANVLVGPNGCGKSNLYRAMWLLAEAAQGRLAAAFAAEGGFPSALWAGDRDSDRVQLSLEVTVDEFEYGLVCGLPTRDRYQIDPEATGAAAPVTAFRLDPEVKDEHLALRTGRRSVEFLRRKLGVAHVRDAEGVRVEHPVQFDRSDSALAQLREAHRFPELSLLREQLRSWRFYHGFRTDADSPIRQPRPGVFTPILGHDGADCAAALQTVIEHGGHGRLAELIDRAIPGAQLALAIDERRALFELQLAMPGLHRPLRAAELSDGTLRYLCLLAALLSPRPPHLLALNEPETSLHPDLLPALAELIAGAAKTTQLWVTTHSRALAETIAAQTGEAPIELQLAAGETRALGFTRFGARE